MNTPNDRSALQLSRIAQYIGYFGVAFALATIACVIAAAWSARPTPWLVCALVSAAVAYLFEREMKLAQVMEVVTAAPARIPPRIPPPVRTRVPASPPPAATRDPVAEYESNLEVFPETAADALRAWDAGGIVWTVTLGGFGPGYEQAIHVIVMEVVRRALALQRQVTMGERDAWMAEIGKLHVPGMSGAQWGQAYSFAIAAVNDGWRETCRRFIERDPDCEIMVSTAWPGRGGAA